MKKLLRLVRDEIDAMPNFVVRRGTWPDIPDAVGKNLDRVHFQRSTQPLHVLVKRDKIVWHFVKLSL